MADGELLVPELDVVGGLWFSAPVRLQDGTNGVVIFSPGGEMDVAVSVSWETMEGGYCDMLGDLEPLSLVLPGPLGLGAAGLAMRIAERLGFDPTYGALLVREHPDFWTFKAGNNWIRVAPVPRFAPNLIVPGTDTDDRDEALAAVSRWLASLDDVCAAVGLECAEWGLPTWHQTDDGWWLGVGNEHEGVGFAAEHLDPDCRIVLALAGIAPDNPAAAVEVVREQLTRRN